MNIKNVATKTARAAGKLLLKEFKDFDRSTIMLKTKRDIVTKADLIAEAKILKEIRKNFPAHQILSEESGKTSNRSDYLWVVDPLDGTTNFSIHNPLWSVSIGVAYKGEVILGVVYAPILDELFIAEKGKGAKLNNKRISVSKVKNGKDIHAYCHGSRPRDINLAIRYYSRQKKQKLDCRQMGSAAIELAYVASGRIESIMIPGAHSWDVSAGALLVNEAGGRVTDFKGRLWNLESEDILASNGRVHREIMAVING